MERRPENDLVQSQSVQRTDLDAVHTVNYEF